MPLNGENILIVEDEALIALDLADAVALQGGTVMGPFATVAAAMDAINALEPKGAILDANLIDRDITPLAICLADMSVPLVVHTGTGLPDALKLRRPEIPVIMKPSPTEFVVASLITQMGESDPDTGG